MTLSEDLSSTEHEISTGHKKLKNKDFFAFIF